MPFNSDDSGLCPCGSGLCLSACCAPVIENDSASSAEALMRSRYTAFVLGHWEYLLLSWHPDTRPSRISRQQTRWLGLSILEHCPDSVEFIAAFKDGRKVCTLHEISRFAKADGHWRYVDGKCEVRVAERNAPCPCGSGKKTKQCCGKPDALGA